MSNAASQPVMHHDSSSEAPRHELRLFEHEYHAASRTLNKELDKKIIMLSAPFAISILTSFIYVLHGLPTILIESALMLTTSTLLAAAGATLFRTRKHKEAHSAKKALNLAYNLELGIYLYERHGITLKGKANPEGMEFFGYDSTDMIYFGNMKKGGHVFRGGIYNTPQGIAYTILDHGTMSNLIH